MVAYIGSIWAILINFDKEVSSISLYEDSSMVFLKIFPFGTNSIYRDLIQLCSLGGEETRLILKKLDLTENISNQSSIFSRTQFN